MSSRPRIFIGSSVEGLRVAEHIQLGLDYDADCTVTLKRLRNTTLSS